MVPLSISAWQLSEEPLAMLVMHQVASNCSFVKSVLYKKPRNFWMRLASITAWIGGFLKDRILRKPVTPRKMRSFSYESTSSTSCAKSSSLNSILCTSFM
jgi:hypothetical protein